MTRALLNTQLNLLAQTQLEAAQASICLSRFNPKQMVGKV
ncbi:hypothetical protein EBME_1050 [bacterium endosymbiont of Mortierella elongata FMR23-6]|nr:hypothetical protein EBME_1050 [bacterium endosymbiont of Mortierella elongata FMR23-6]